MKEKITDVTYDWLFDKIKKKDLKITEDEMYSLFMIINRPFENLEIDWCDKTLHIKGLNVTFDVLLKKAVPKEQNAKG